MFPYREKEIDTVTMWSGLILKFIQQENSEHAQSSQKKRAALEQDKANTSPTSAAGKLWFGLMAKSAAYGPKVRPASLQSHTKYLCFPYT